MVKNSIKVLKDLFQEKILKFNEGSNLLVCLLKKIPKIRDKFTDDWFGKDKEKSRNQLGIITLIAVFICEFLKKMLYACIFLYIPYRILGNLLPNVLNNQEKSIMYFFMIMTTFTGSITNCTVFSMSDTDYIMLRVIRVKTTMHYLGKVIYKMITELVYFTLILLILGVSFKYSIAVSIVTIAIRPIGECICLLIYDYAQGIHKNRGAINGLVMAAAFIIAYVFPYVNRTISNRWYKVANPIFLIGIVIVSVGSLYFLWKYKKYEQIAQEGVYIRREDKL